MAFSHLVFHKTHFMACDYRVISRIRVSHSINRELEDPKIAHHL